jgi:hypothetical protein
MCSPKGQFKKAAKYNREGIENQEENLIDCKTSLTGGHS